MKQIRNQFNSVTFYISIKINNTMHWHRNYNMKLKRKKYFQQLVKFNASVIIVCK